MYNILSQNKADIMRYIVMEPWIFFRISFSIFSVKLAGGKEMAEFRFSQASDVLPDMHYTQGPDFVRSPPEDVPKRWQLHWWAK